MNFLPWVSFSFLQPFDRKPSFPTPSMWLSSVVRQDPIPGLVGEKTILLGTAVHTGKSMGLTSQRTGLGPVPGPGGSTREENGKPVSALAWRTPWQRTLAGYSPRGCKELDITERLTPSLSAEPRSHNQHIYS